MLLWLLTLPASGVVSIVTATPGCISLIVRLHLLAARMSLTTEESLLFAGRALQNLLQLPQSAWDPEFTNELDKTHPSVVNDILYRVIKDTERRPMNCPALKGGFIILSNICRAPVLNIDTKGCPMVEKETIKMATGTIKMGCHYLLEAISQQGYECVVQAVNFRLLSSMLRSTAMVEDDLTTENPNSLHPLFTIYGRLLKGIASHTMYRSVLSALERALDRIETQLLDHLVVSSPFSDKMGHTVPLDTRTEMFLGWIIQRDIRVDRKKFLRAHQEYRVARQNSESKPLSSTTDEEVLVTRLDYRIVLVASTVITFQDAPREYKLHCQWFKGDPDKVPRLLKEVRVKKKNELPLTMALYPYGLLTGAWIGFGVLKAQNCRDECYTAAPKVPTSQ
ncbi:hypothetical protein GG344DRAFT_81491 [Lentinula edodes]|nr:hypothetical protein GG344DRAFT_81491 [Lentinula edodes]